MAKAQKKESPAARVPLERARAHWLVRQGLATPAAGPIADVVAKTGWLRTLGGAEVYLAARARVAGLSRAAMDAASAAQEVQVVPAVRGCIYLLPRAHVPLALAYAESIWRKGADRDLGKAGSSWKEVAEVAAAVEAALSRPLPTDAIRKALPDGTVRSFGERGKKIGLSSPLPIALRDLEFRGIVERTLDGGRLDTERYLWRKPAKSVFAGAKVPKDAAGLATEIARIFYAQIGATTARDFADWAGLGLGDARAALAGLPLVPVAIEGYADDALVLESQKGELAEASATGAVAVLGFEDNFAVLHGGPAILADPSTHGMTVDVWGSGKRTTLGKAKHLSNRIVIVDGALAAFWEFDPSGEAVVAPLGKLGAAAKKVDAAVKDAATFLSNELGHGRSFTLDTDEALADRASRLRAMAKKGPR